LNGVAKCQASWPSLLDEIIKASQNLHGSGTFPPRVLEIMAKHLSSGPVRNSAETGCGVSTLIFSHLSYHHTVFALDYYGSLSNTRASELLNSATTEFVEGPTQKTLPNYMFHSRLQAVLLDGPHAFPYPALEYYYFYPQLEEDALLIIDDIQIRSVYDFFKFLRADRMFRLVQVVGPTAFFRRTSAPMFNPVADDWWLQEYNRRCVAHVVWRDRIQRPLPAKFDSLRRYLKRGIARFV
jgi:hypothetical protein